jgi:hypothetical protein
MLELSDTMVTAGLSGVVSLAVALASQWTAARRLQAEDDRLERQIESGAAHRLYELRMQVYPRAFEITAELGKTSMLSAASAVEKMSGIADELRAWRQGAPALVMSDASLRAYHRLLQAITRNPALGTNYSEAQLTKIWRTRLAFRGELRRDVGLLEAERRGRRGDALSRGTESSVTRVELGTR